MYKLYEKGNPQQDTHNCRRVENVDRKEVLQGGNNFESL